MKAFPAQSSEERPLHCRMPGCRNAWTVDIMHGMVCSFHDEQLSHSHGNKPPGGMPKRQTAIPLREAVRPFSEPVEHDDQVEF